MSVVGQILMSWIKGFEKMKREEFYHFEPYLYYHDCILYLIPRDIKNTMN